MKVQKTFTPVKLTNPQPGVWVFDFGQNFAGWPELRLPDGIPAGTIVKMLPAETLNANGTVNQASIGVGGRGSDIFATYTTLGTPGGETWRPKFNYFAMQYLQVTGLPAGFTPTTDMIRGLQLFADVPRAGDIETSNERINRIHRMSYYSITSNTMSVFTDCPGREKLPYGADYVQPMGSLNVNFDYAAYLRNMQVQLVEGQSKAGPTRATWRSRRRSTTGATPVSSGTRSTGARRSCRSRTCSTSSTATRRRWATTSTR